MKPLPKRLLLATLPALAFAAALAIPASAHTPAVYLDGAEQWTQGRCDSDETPIVVASDSKAQSDIYAAVMLAGVLETDCVILAGDRQSSVVPSAQKRRLENTSVSRWYVVGGEAAVSSVKVNVDFARYGLERFTRIGGATRWATLAQVGRVAAETAATERQEEKQEPKPTITVNGCPSDRYIHGLSDMYRDNTDLRCADFSSAKLRDSNFDGRNLNGANFSGANILHASFVGAKLRGANFSSANATHLGFHGANFRGADLYNADLRNATLGDSDFGSADLRNADLRNADLSYANFGSADLRNADLRDADLSDSTNFGSARTEGCRGCP